MEDPDPKARRFTVGEGQRQILQSLPAFGTEYRWANVKTLLSGFFENRQKESKKKKVGVLYEILSKIVA